MRKCVQKMPWQDGRHSPPSWIMQTIILLLLLSIDIGHIIIQV